MQKSIKTFNDHNERCKITSKAGLGFSMLAHLFAKCCPINTPKSAYCIFIADSFYQYLHETKYIPAKTIESNEFDIRYLKYLY